MILTIDVHYKEKYAKAVGVLFSFQNISKKEVIVEKINDVKEYVPGQFYKRELPCLLQIIERIDLEKIEVIIVDGHIYIDNDKNFGLGGHLWSALKEKIPIIGVAKRSFFNNHKTVIPVLRGKSKNPLYISSVGIDVEDASELIKNMEGDYRIPDILKELDQITKSE
ncbi:endonuclease V [Flavobacteriaceae bacterium R38]|nr:endonuclease V [Flavobacteriaceae bacterium R38]